MELNREINDVIDFFDDKDGVQGFQNGQDSVPLDLLLDLWKTKFDWSGPVSNPDS